LLAVAAFGLDVVRSYFELNPVARLPEWVFREPENQSLHASLLRWTDDDALARASFLLAALALGAVSAWLIARVARELGALGLALGPPLALLVSRGTLSHYGVLLPPPMLWVWGHRGVLGLSPLAAGAFITAQFTFVGAAHEWTFWALALAWFGLAIL